jgi:hypothetical protein
MLDRFQRALIRGPQKFGGVVKHLLTIKDGKTYAPSRVYWCLAALTQITLTFWHVMVLGKDFSSTDFGTGMGLILTSGGVGVWITRKTEPE